MQIEALEPRKLLSATPAPVSHIGPAAVAVVVTNSQGRITIHPTAGTSFTGVVATFHLDSTPPPIVETGADISWGDGGDSAGQIVQGSGGDYTVIGTHLYARPGTYGLRVLITQGPRCPMPDGGPCPEFPTQIIQTIESTAIVAPEPGDADGDGHVDFADLLAVAQHYGTAGSWSTGDFNADGSVGFDDLLLLAQHYSRGPVA